MPVALQTPPLGLVVNS